MKKIRKKILITGGSGFLGGYLVKSAQFEYNVFATYLSNRPDYPNVKWLYLNLGKLEDIENVLIHNRPDLVIHNAAITDVDYCEKHPELTKLINISASKKISAVCNSIGSRIVYISSDLVFSGASPPYSESTEPEPLSNYGLSKWHGELATAATNPNHIIVRPSIMYGPPGIGGTSFSEKLRTSWKNGVVTNLFTDQIRTPIFGGNLADAIIELSQIDFAGILNLSGSEKINRYKFGLYLADCLKFDRDLVNPVKMADIKLTGKRPGDVSLNNDLAKKLLQTRLLDCREGIRNAYGT